MRVWLLLRVLLTVAWIYLCTALLVGGLATVREPSLPENLYGVVAFHQGIRAMSFPLGFVAWHLLYVAIGMTARPSPETQLWLVWLVVGGVGYLQWFHLVPWGVKAFLHLRVRAKPTGLLDERSSDRPAEKPSR